jgi:phenylacetate-CoA ligase
VIRRTFREIDRTQWLPPEQIAKIQVAKAKRLVAFAKKRVPMYRNLYSNDTVIESIADFRSLPKTSRKDFADCDTSYRTAEKLPIGQQMLFSETTSGTTGDVVTINRTNLLEAWRHACIIREFDWWNIDPNGTCAVIRMPANRQGTGWNEEINGTIVNNWSREGFELLFGKATGYHMDASAKPEQIAKSIMRLQPDYIQATGTLLLSIAEYLSDYRPKALLTIGENLYSSMKASLIECFHAPVFDIYAAVETNRTAASCPGSERYHVHDENVIVEILRDDGSICGPGEVGNVVVTSLHNYSTPVIRYDIGDLAEVPRSPCPCGRGLTTIESFQGREIARLRLEGGRKRIALGFVMTMNDIPGVKKFRLTQRGLDNFDLRITGRDTLTVEEFERVKQSIEQTVERSIALRMTPVDDIPLGPRGKLTKIEFVD